MEANKTWFILLRLMKPKYPLFVQRRMRKREGTHFECVCLQVVENIFRGAEEGECRKPNKEEKSGHLGF